MQRVSDAVEEAVKLRAVLGSSGERRREEVAASWRRCRC